jgi:predicted ATPase/DNA-binding CsgD family transcriptional regulator
MPLLSLVCVICGDKLPRQAGPAGRLYCSNACRQRAYRKRATRTSDTETYLATPAISVALDSFVGRQRELADVAAALRRSSVVTLLGPAGVGKTRIAREVAGAVRGNFRDGVVVVDLAPVHQPELIWSAVAATAGVADRAGTRGGASVAEALGGRHQLLVLDNCEHLVGACAALIEELTTRAPGLRMLTTSREPLRVADEVVLPLDPLPEHHAIELFAERAAQAEPGFTVTDGNRSAVRAVCRHLDRLPLAIELAARMVRLYPIRDILTGLRDRFQLLTSGVRTAHAQHRSLYAAIDWSYDLLSGDERALFRRLAVLDGSFGTALAKAAARDLDVAVPELLDSLRSKSLLVVPPDRGTGSRWGMLESVRAYARQRLDEQGEWDLALGGVVAHLSTMVRSLAGAFITPTAAESHLTAELDNLSAVIRCLDLRTDERAPLLVFGLACCRARQGIVADIRELLAAAVECRTAPSEERVLALEQAAWLAGFSNDHAAALNFAHQAVDRADEAPLAIRARALAALAFAQQVSGDPVSAAETFGRCLVLVRQLDEPAGVALCLNNIAWAKIGAGDLYDAAALLAEAAPIHEASPDRDRLAAVLHTLGALHLERADTGAAAAYFTRSLRALDGRESMTAPHVFEGMAMVAIRQRDHERGLRLVAAADRVRRRSGVSAWDDWWHARVTEAVAKARAALTAQAAEAAARQGRALTRAGAMAYALREATVDPAVTAASARLSRPERQIAALVAGGWSNHEIADRLQVSDRTVRNHLKRVREILGLRSRAHVAAWAARNLTGTVGQPDTARVEPVTVPASLGSGPLPCPDARPLIATSTVRDG